MSEPPIEDPEDARARPPAAADLDRTITPVAGRLGPGLGGKALAFTALVAGCGIFLAATWGREAKEPPRAPDQPARQVVPFEALQAGPAGSGAPPPQLRADPGGPDVPALRPDTPTAPGAGPTTERAGRPQAEGPAPLLVFSRRSGSEGPADARLPASSEPPAPRSAETRALEGLPHTSTIARARATRLPDRNFLLVAGAAIPCILQTAMDSATPGFVSCVIPSDVYSDNGAVVLLEKGTRVLGEYRGSLRQGQKRLFVLWTRAVTPAGVAIALGSPAADALGRAGFEGRIDTHFWDRFGGALLLSVVDDGVFAVADGAGRSGTARLPSDAAAMALEGSVAIAPTLRKAQGGEVAILVAKDFDFSGVYSLRAR